MLTQKEISKSNTPNTALCWNILGAVQLERQPVNTKQRLTKATLGKNKREIK
jgi:hypothetical protein